MKRFLSFQLFIGVMTFLFLLLNGCTTYKAHSPNVNLTNEVWMNQLVTSPNRWAVGADSWFIRGESNPIEMAERQAPDEAMISTMHVRVPEFRNIKVNGDFQVQIFGTDQPNSVYIYGPNEDVSGTVVTVKAGILCVDQIRPTPNMRKVIIRIGVRHLQRLVQMGCGTIEAVHIRGRNMEIISNGSGNMYVGGQLNLRYVENNGSGAMNLFGVYSRDLKIKTSGGGTTNLYGQMAVSLIQSSGMSRVNIIGANSANLSIYALGGSKVSVVGPVNLQEVVARDSSSVYVCNVRSTSLHVCVDDNGMVGLAGTVGSLTVEAYKNACFSGRNLCAANVFARAKDAAHINIASSERIFSSAVNHSSIYVYGQPRFTPEFVSGNGVVFQIPTYRVRNCAIYHHYNFK